MSFSFNFVYNKADKVKDIQSVKNDTVFVQVSSLSNFSIPFDILTKNEVLNGRTIVNGLTYDLESFQKISNQTHSNPNMILVKGLQGRKAGPLNEPAIVNELKMIVLQKMTLIQLLQPQVSPPENDAVVSVKKKEKEDLPEPIRTEYVNVLASSRIMASMKPFQEGKLIKEIFDDFNIMFDDE